MRASRACSTPCNLACSEAARAAPACPMRLALPFEAPTRERLEADLRRIRPRLN